MDRFEDVADRFSFTLCTQNSGLRFTLSLEDLSLAFTLSSQNLGLLDAFCGEDRGTAVTFSTHLLFHRVLDGHRRINRLELNAGYADTPAAGRLIENTAQLTVDAVTGGQGFFKVHAADHVT